MSTIFWLCMFFLSFQPLVFSQGSSNHQENGVIKGTVSVNSSAAIGKTDADFVCATLDWWPPDKCEPGNCSWGRSSLLNLDLSNNRLINSIKAFSGLKLRLGGTLQDVVIYGAKDSREPCLPFVKKKSAMFGFTQGCLPMKRWDELNIFFQKVGAKVVFGLNALTGKKINIGGTASGAWDYSNAESLIRYTAEKNYTVDGWELGNELCGKGVGTGITAERYALDTIALHKIVQSIYKDINPKPKIISPGGFFDVIWFKEFLAKSSKYVDAVTHHIYNLGPGADEHLVERILDPATLDNTVGAYSALQNMLKSSATSVSAWVGEGGGAFGSGRDLVTNAFVFSFWYLDQLGMAASYDTKTYCKQSLVGGNYGFFNTKTFLPNPDYFSALLWRRLMGRKVLSASFSGTKYLRAYAHCAKQSKGITLLLLNLDRTATVQVDVALNGSRTLTHKYKFHKTKPIQLRRVSNSGILREEYHLTGKDGYLQSQTMMLNGKMLSLDSFGNAPPFKPVYVDSSLPIKVAPLSTVFAHLPGHVIPACGHK